jgi:hypothetical protein
VSFCRRINKGHQELAGIRVSELRQYIPQLVPFLLQDSYFTPNASYRTYNGLNTVTGLPHPLRGAKHNKGVSPVRYLNALYVDCDAYKAGLTWPQAAEIILRAQDQGVIPWYSILVRSGQGIYVMWLLKNERPGVHARATINEIALYRSLSEKVHDVLHAYEPRLVPDRSQQGRLLGILRTPGSEHVKAGLPVLYNVQAVQDVGVPVYTLEGLATFLKVPVLPAAPISKRVPYVSGSGKPVLKPGSCPARRRGRLVTGERMMQDLLAIAQHRQGIEQGKRHTSLWYLIHCARNAGLTMSDAQVLAEKFAATCRPPYPSGDDNDVPVSEIIKSVWTERTTFKKFKAASVAKFYDVTQEIAEQIELRTIIPAETRQARAAAPGPRHQEQVARREIVAAMIADHPGRVPSVRKVRARLQAAGLDASLPTISKDVKAMLARPKASR